MKDYLFKLGKQAKKASINTIKSKKKDKVLQDYCNLIFNYQLNIIRENKITDPLWGYKSFTVRVYVAQRNPKKSMKSKIVRS